jgi:cell division protein FtsW
VVAVWKPYRLERLTSFTNPWADQFDSGYQLTQALIAFGRGEMLGTGLGNSMQKQFFLPEAHTDFLFSIIAEELGAVGALILVALFTLLVLRCLSLGKTLIAAEMPFHGYLAYGIALLIGIQALINIGVNIGRLPTKGLTLPLISFGGNSLIVSCLMIGVLIRIEYEYRTRPMAALRRRQ